MFPVFTGLWQRQADYKHYSNIYLARTPQVWGVVVGTVRLAHNPSLKVQVLVLCRHIQWTVLAPRVALFVFQGRAEGLRTCGQQIASGRCLRGSSGRWQPWMCQAGGTADEVQRSGGGASRGWQFNYSAKSWSSGDAPLDVLAPATAEGIIKICLGGFIPSYY